MLKRLEKKYNISIIKDQYEPTYAIYKNNELLGYIYSLRDIDSYMTFKNS